MKKAFILFFLAAMSSFPFSSRADDGQGAADVLKALKAEGEVESEAEKAGISLFGRSPEFHLLGDDSHQYFPGRSVDHEPPKRGEAKDIFDDLMISVTSSFNSQYFSREMPLSRGPVWQPTAVIEYKGFGFQAWTNFVLNDEPNQGEFNEVDLIPYYTAHIGNLTIHPYFMFIVYPTISPQSLDYSPHPNIESDLYLQYDLRKFKFFGRLRARLKQTLGQIYGQVGAGFTQKFAGRVALYTSVMLTVENQKYMTTIYGHGADDANVDALAFNVALPVECFRGFVFRPNVNAAVHMVPSIRRAIGQTYGLNNYFVWGGFDLSYDF